MILSRNMLKRVGESRHPRRNPIVVRNQSPLLLLKMTALVAVVYEDSHKAGADVIRLHGCPQSCMAKPVEGLLEVYEDMVEVLLVLEIFLIIIIIFNPLTARFVGAPPMILQDGVVILYVCQGTVTTVQDRSGKCLTEEQQILNRWTKYCFELYNYKANGDPSVLNCLQTDTEDGHPILRRDEEAAVQSLKKGKLAERVDNIPAELVQAGG